MYDNECKQTPYRKESKFICSDLFSQICAERLSIKYFVKMRMEINKKRQKN